MLLPNQNAIARTSHAGSYQELNLGALPQAKACTPCVRLGGGRRCLNLPIFGRKCFNVPYLGSWKFCCRTRWGWPPIKCGIRRC